VNYALNPTTAGLADATATLDWVRPNFASRQIESVELIAPGDADPCPEEIQSLIAAARHGRAAQSALSPLFRDASGNVRMALVAPITALTGEPTGFVVRMLVDPTSTLFADIQQWPTPSPSGEALLVARDGDDTLLLSELRHRRAPLLTLRMPLVQDTPAQEALTTATSGATASQSDYRGVAVLASWRAIPNSNWAIVAKIDAAEVFAPLRGLFWSLTTTLAALVLGGCSKSERAHGYGNRRRSRTDLPWR
jgi:hypothetical protein